MMLSTKMPSLLSLKVASSVASPSDGEQQPLSDGPQVVSQPRCHGGAAVQNLTLLPVFKTAMIPAKVVQRGCQPALPAVIPALPGASQALTSLPSVPLPTGIVVPLD